MGPDMSFDQVYRAALDQLSQAVCICGPDGRLIYINPEARRIAIPQAGDFEGRQFSDVFSGICGEALSSIQRAISENSILQECARVRLESGDAVFRIEVSPMQDPRGAGSVISFEPERHAASSTDGECEVGVHTFDEHYSLLQRLIENIPNPIFYKGTDGRYLGCNSAFERMLGLKKEEIIGKLAQDISPDYLAEKYSQKDQELFSSPGIQSYEFAIKSASGKIHNVIFNKATYNGQDGEIAGIVGVIIDITERKRSEEELRSAHQKLQSIIEFLPDATFVVDKDKKVIAWNRAIEEMTGVSKSDVLGRGDYAYAVPFYGRSIPMLLDLIEAGDKETESRYQYVERIGDTIYAEVFVPSLSQGNGAYVWGKASPLIDEEGNVVGSIESIRDVTDRKMAEKELQKRDVLLSGVAVAANILLTVPDYTSAVNQALEILGLSAEIDRVYIFENHEDDGKLFTSQKFEWSRPGIDPQIDNPYLQNRSFGEFSPFWHESMASGEPISCLVRSLSEKERELLEMQGILSVLLVPIFIDSWFWGFIGFDDCTFERVWTKSEISILTASAGSIGAAIVRKMTEERLQLLESAVNNTDEAVVIASEHPPKSHNFRIVYVNEAFTRITGYEFDEVVGNRPEMLQGPDTDPVHMEVLKKAFARQEHVNVELINYRKDGSEFWQELNIVPVKNTKGDVTHWVSLQRDTTERKKAEEALRETKDYLESLIGYANAPIIVWDPSFKITRFNRAFERLTGRKAEEVLGRSLEMLFPLESRDESLTYIWRTLSGERWESLEIPILRADGSVRTVLWNSASLYSEDGTRVIATIAQGQDITERKQAEEKVQFQASLLDQVRSSVIATDTRGNIVYWNKFSEELYQWKEEEVLGKNIADVIVPEGMSRVPEKLISDLALSGHYESELPVKRKDGTIFLAGYTFSIVKDACGNHVGDIGVCVDVTERKKAEEELLRAKDLATDATRAKSQFLANMSHEIRTPMNAVIGMAGLLLSTDLTPRQQEYVDTIRASGDLLLEIINDILDFSKIEEGNLELESQPFDLTECIEASVDLVASTALKKGLSLSYSVDPQVPTSLVGDVTKLRQILVNLLANAVKFTDSGGVSVHVSSDLSGDERGIQIAVADTGIGIPESQASRLFQSFSQVDSSITRRYGGTGLGLAISRRLVELMGGRIWAKSKPGAGSTFYISIPEKVDLLAEDQPHPEESWPKSKKAVTAPDAMVAKRHPLRIMLAEDNLVNQKVALLMLERMGYRADVTANGLEAVQAMGRQDYDVVLMDVQMPEMDGLEATRCIRQMFPEKQPYVIAMTAHALKGDREICFEAGMDDYVSKPVKMQELQFALEEASLKIEKRSPLDQGVLSSLRELQMEGDPDIIVELGGLFMSRAHQRLESMMAAIENGDPTALYKEAHNMKSSSANLGALRLSSICKDLEQIGRSGNLSGARELLGIAESEYERVRASLEEEMRTSTQTQGQSQN